MKKKEIIEKCIEAYTAAIEKAKTSKMSRDRLLAYLDKNNQDAGVCYFIEYNLGEENPQFWIKKHVKTNQFGDETDWNHYWGVTPRWAKNRKEMVQALQIRLDNLQKELKTCRK